MSSKAIAGISNQTDCNAREMIIYIWLRLLCGVVSFTGGGGEAIILACRRVQSTRGEDKGGFNKPAGTLPPPDWQTRFV